MFADAHVDPAYTFSLLEEELPEDEAPAIVKRDHQSTIAPVQLGNFLSVRGVHGGAANFKITRHLVH